jgi:hypothetical protein
MIGHRYDALRGPGQQQDALALVVRQRGGPLELGPGLVRPGELE